MSKSFSSAAIIIGALRVKINGKVRNQKNISISKLDNLGSNINVHLTYINDVLCCTLQIFETFSFTALTIFPFLLFSPTLAKKGPCPATYYPVRSSYDKYKAKALTYKRFEPNGKTLTFDCCNAFGSQQTNRTRCFAFFHSLMDNVSQSDDACNILGLQVFGQTLEASLATFGINDASVHNSLHASQITDCSVHKK